MHFFRKILNLDHVERIEWFNQIDGRGFDRNNVSYCTLYFASGHVQTLMRPVAVELFDYLAVHEQGFFAQSFPQ